MIGKMTFACAAALLLSAPARNAETKAVLFAKNTPVVVVGPITSAPKDAVGEQKMQIGIGPERVDYTLHFRDAALYGLNGQKIESKAFTNGQWVRAEGKVRDDARRIDVNRIQVIAPDEKGHRRTAFYRTGLDHGYISSVAGTRQTFPAEPVSLAAPFTIIGKISDDTGPFSTTRKVQMKSQGFEWTLHIPKDATVLDAAGKELSVHEVAEGQWVRAHGWRNGDLRMRVERLENIGPDAAFRTSTFYRTTDPLGYVEAVEGPDYFTQMRVSGVVTDRNADFGSITVRDGAGREHVIYTDAATITGNGQRIYFDNVKVGDTITIEGRTFKFVR